MTESAADPQQLARDAQAIARELPVPPCPAILADLTAEMNREEPDTRRVASLIGSDPGLAASMIQAANSPLYGLQRKVASVAAALAVLGLRAGAGIVAGVLLRKAFPASAGGAMQKFWDRSMRATELAAELAPKLRRVDATDAASYVLFRDCGAAVMITQYPDYPPVFDQLREKAGRAVTLLENQKFRYDHARVGYALARGWLLPEPLAHAILVHHEFGAIAEGRREVEPANLSLVAFGLLVEQVEALREGRGLCPDWEAGESLVLARLGITTEDVLAFAQEPAA